MSILVAVRSSEDGVICLGSDSLVTSGVHSWSLPDGKWIELPCGIWVGSAGSVRTTALIESLVDPTHDVRGLVEAVKRALVADGWTPDQSPGTPNGFDLELLLVSLNEGIHHVADDLSRIPCEDVGVAGSGRAYALGALSALTSSRPSQYRVSEALRAAVEHDPNCGDPLHIRWIDDEAVR
jgi:ATP-dependent protease HslVU (ClpYQ) peptidase subunit